MTTRRVTSSLALCLLAVVVLTSAPQASASVACSPSLTPEGHQYRSPGKRFVRADVWVYGDSLTYQTQQHLRSTTSGHVLAIDAKSGRTTMEGIDALKLDVARYPRHLPAVLVMALGTNDVMTDLSEYAAQVASVRSLVPASTRVLWVNVWRYSATQSNPVNEILGQAGGMRVLLWARVVRRDDARYLIDHTHVNAAGCVARDALIRKAIGR